MRITQAAKRPDTPEVAPAEAPRAQTPQSRAKTPEEEKTELKEDLGYLVTVVNSEGNMLTALAKIEAPETMVSWHRALGVTEACVKAVKNVPEKEADSTELELLLTLVEDAKDDVD